MNSNQPAQSIRRKRLLWRATHRGIREMDLILGGFVSQHIESLDGPGLDALEAIMDMPDQDMLAWATRQAPVPEQLASPMLMQILFSRPQGKKSVS